MNLSQEASEEGSSFPNRPPTHHPENSKSSVIANCIYSWTGTPMIRMNSLAPFWGSPSKVRLTKFIGYLFSSPRSKENIIG